MNIAYRIGIGLMFISLLYYAYLGARQLDIHKHVVEPCDTVFTEE